MSKQVGDFFKLLWPFQNTTIIQILYYYIFLASWETNYLALNKFFVLILRIFLKLFKN